MVTRNHPQHPPPWLSSAGLFSPSPRHPCLFLSVFRKEVTINDLLSFSLKFNTTAAYGYSTGRDTGLLSATSLPEFSTIQQTLMPGQPPPTSWKDRHQWNIVKESRSTGEPSFKTHLDIFEPILMFDPLGWQDSRTDQIWDQILALRSCSLMPLPKLFNTPSFSSFLCQVGLITV